MFTSAFPLFVFFSFSLWRTVYDSTEDDYEEDILTTHELASMTKAEQEECIKSVVQAAIEEVLEDLEHISCDIPLTAYMTAIDFMRFHYELSQALPIIRESGMHLICEKEPTIDLIVRRVMEAVERDQGKEVKTSPRPQLSTSPLTHVLAFFRPSAKKRSNSDADEEKSPEGRRPAMYK